MATTEVLAFDWGTSILGVLDVNTNEYIPYHYGEEMIQGAKRVISSIGTIVSFNGNRYDLLEIAKILGLSSVAELHISGEHNDMLRLSTDSRWPPTPNPILGTNLLKMYKHYFDDQTVTPPSHLQVKYEGTQLEYVENNWRDCYMTAELWKKWKRGELVPE